MKCTDLKNEAIERMQILKLEDKIIQAFKDTDTLYVSNLGGTLEVANDEQMQFVKDIEQAKNILVYHFIHRTTQHQDTTYCLFVDDNKKSWKDEKKDLENQFTLALCYTKVISFKETGMWIKDGKIIDIT